jgi:hypothetical protein
LAGSVRRPETGRFFLAKQAQKNNRQSLVLQKFDHLPDRPVGAAACNNLKRLTPGCKLFLPSAAAKGYFVTSTRFSTSQFTETIQSWIKFEKMTVSPVTASWMGAAPQSRPRLG